MSLRKRPSAAKKIAGDDAEKTVVSNELLYPTLKACAVLCALLVRAAVGMWGYSGQGKPPMYGDFEAQRHWMEITTATPIGEWYFHTEDNDLMYWGLDYPPLTAFVSYAFGALAHVFLPELVALKESRGFESDAGKSFMRLTVLLCDAVVFIPAVLAVLSCTKWKQKSQKQALLLLLVALFSPSIILIDHGHFQYNGVCIGLALMASAAMLAEADVAASALFCLSLNFKQMALYYAPVFFFGLLGNCIRKGTHVEGFIHLCKIGATVVATFAAMWLPFCLSPMLGESCWSSLLQILHRLFPFARGIFEDKVANFWYVASVVYDFRGKIAQDGLVKLSLCLTLFLLAPTALFLLKRKLSYDKIILALVTSSLAFFLCSFQVHEKSLLLSTVPAALYFGRDPQIVSWFQLLGAFTLFPLIAKDEQAVPYLLSQIIFLILMLYYYLDTCRQQVRDGMIVTSVSTLDQAKLAFAVISCIGMLVLHTGFAFIEPPQRYPDLFPALFAIYGFVNLGLAYIYFAVSLWM